MYRPLKTELSRAAPGGQASLLERAVRAGGTACGRKPCRRILSAERALIPIARCIDRLPALDVASLPGAGRDNLFPRPLSWHQPPGAVRWARSHLPFVASRRSIPVTSRFILSCRTCRSHSRSPSACSRPDVSTGSPSSALALGLQWSLGHFQIQMWTSALVVLFSVWHVASDRRKWERAIGTVVAAALGLALAAVQLGLSWQFATLVNQTERSVDELSFYSFPPAHWFELALPRPVRELRQGAEDPYWFVERTTGFEAACYIGTIPLVFAIAGYFRRPAGQAHFALAADRTALLCTGDHAAVVAGGLRAHSRFAWGRLLSRARAIYAADEPRIGPDRGRRLRPRDSAARFRLGLFTSLAFAGCATFAAWRWSLRAGCAPRLDDLWRCRRHRLGCARLDGGAGRRHRVAHASVSTPGYL